MELSPEPTPAHRRIAALQAWRTRQLDGGVRPAVLPDTNQLVMLATAVNPSASPLMTDERVRSWREDILAICSPEGTPAPLVVTGRTLIARGAPNGPAAETPAEEARDSSRAVAAEGKVTHTERSGVAASPMPSVPVSTPSQITPPTRSFGPRPAPDTGTPLERIADPPPAGSLLPGPEEFAYCEEPVYLDVEAPSMSLSMIRGEQYITWPRAERAGFVVYRLVVGGQAYAASPDETDDVVVTRDPMCPVRQVLTGVEHAVVWLRVWANRGEDRDVALRGQPELLAQDPFVVPPFALRHDVVDRRVMLSWEINPRAVEAEVHRVRPGSREPMDRPRDETRVVAGVRNQCQLLDHETGEWEYRVYALATVGEALVYSPPAICRVAVSASLSRVGAVTRSENPDGTVRLRWKRPPAGRVTLHRTVDRIDPELQHEPLSESAIELENPDLSIARQLALHPSHDDVHEWIDDPPLPSGVGGHYVTPVVRLDGMGWVGESVWIPTLRPVTDLRVHERTDVQLLTFTLPEQARWVWIYITSPGQEELDLSGEGVLEVDAEDYRRTGRVTLPSLDGGLPCRIHVVPVFELSPRKLGPTSWVDYPGLIVLRYRLGPDTTAKAVDGSAGRYRLLEARNHSARAVSAVFRVCWNPQRLPLHSEDGTTLIIAPDGSASVQVNLPEWNDAAVAMVPIPEIGYLRAFAEVTADGDEAAVVALLDPPPDALRCGP